MLVAAAFCPHPPVILPEIAGGASADLDMLRKACDESIERLVRARVEEVVVVGNGPRTHRFGAAACGSLAGFGVDVRAGWGAGDPDPEPLPLSLTVGAWLLARAGWSGPTRGLAVAGDVSPPGCLALGRSVRSERLGLLVMGDGSARREIEAPGYLDERAAGFDRRVSALLAAADATGLAELDPVLAGELLAAGRPAWQVAAGAVTHPMRGAVLYDEAPYGVGYLVAGWEMR